MLHSIIVPPLCKLLDDPESGMVQYSFEIDGISSEGNACVYKCNDGFTIQGGSVKECQSDRSWSGSEPIYLCER